MVKGRAADKIDLAVALAMAVGVLQDLARENLRDQGRDDEWELANIHDTVEFEPTYLQPDDPEPPACFGPDTSWEIAEAALSD